MGRVGTSTTAAQGGTVAGSDHEQETNVTTEHPTVRRTDHGRVAVLELDYPGRSMNMVDERLLRDFSGHVSDVLADERIDAFVLASAKPTSFGAGADVSWLPELAARADAESFLAGVHRLMVRLVRSPKPMVAAINGVALGGALELALGARAIVAASGSTLGLPEVTLGLLPGGGGTQLITRFVTVGTAAELLTSGRRIGAEEALRLGLVDSVVEPENLLDKAVERARELVTSARRARRPMPPEALREVEERRRSLAAGRSGLSPAMDQILTVLEAGVKEGLEGGLAAERRAFLTLLRTPQARAAIHLFQIESDVKRRSRGSGEPVARLGVVGAGQMGSGIAATAVTRGVAAVVRDVGEEQLRRARSYLDRVLARGGRDGNDRRLWSGTTGWDGFAEADAVVEAVFELPDLKKDVLRQLSGVVSGSALLATNTSAISIAELATAVDHPERFIGMHFFSPVERMPLVELIPHPTTSRETAERAAALGRQLGKVPITVGDAPGFFTSRVYARWLMEGIRLLLDGIAPGTIDAAAKAAGFPVGPLQAHDEATLELVLQASIGQVADKVMTDRLDVAAVRAALETLVAAEVRGRRHGLGFYRYDEDGKRVGPNDAVLSLLGVTPAALPPATIGERLLLAFATECFLCWDDGTLCHPHDGDIGSVLGIGFPRVLGGPFQWADEVGAAEVIARCRKLGTKEFPVGPAVERMAADGGRFGDQPRRPAPFTEPLKREV